MFGIDFFLLRILYDLIFLLGRMPWMSIKSPQWSMEKDIWMWSNDYKKMYGAEVGKTGWKLLKLGLQQRLVLFCHFMMEHLWIIFREVKSTGIMVNSKMFLSNDVWNFYTSKSPSISPQNITFIIHQKVITANHSI